MSASHCGDALALPIVLVGLPGAGKSKVGALLAQMLGAPHVDTDDLVSADAGMSIEDIFATEGEASFRQREALAVERAVQMPAVVSLGGGAVTTPRVRELLRGVTVVFIDVAHDELLRRLASKTGRPLLRDDLGGSLQRLRAERAPLYAQVATVRVPSGEGPASEVAAAIRDLLTAKVTRVAVGGEKPYEVVIGADVPAAFVSSALRSQATKVLLIHAPGLEAPAEALAAHLEALGLQVHVTSHPAGEAAKDMSVLEGMWRIAGEVKLGRADAVVSLGGGATTDMGGFVAATWLRGVDHVCVPTTLLAMVDAAIGGKTGVNSPAGKNLIGAFHTPARVVCDLRYLATLPPGELRAGLGEVIKCGFIADTQILNIVEDAQPEQLLDPSSAQLAQLVHRAAAVKARVVSEDLRESGLREILNYGHTFAHAVERCENYRVKHGEAVAIGCVFAAHLAHSRGILSSADVQRHVAAFEKVGLPTRYEGAPLGDLLDVMLSDKKVRAGQLRFVLLDGVGNPVTQRIDPEELTQPASQIGVQL